MQITMNFPLAALLLLSTFSNPVDTANVPDPGVLVVGQDYYAVSTSGNAPRAFPIRHSTDLQHWEVVGHALPQRPDWAESDFWAPELHRVGDGYNLYYTAREKGGQLCIGVATGPSPTGPFTDLGRPLIQSDRIGQIDPNYCEGYLYWKVDGNANNQPTPILAARLSPDGLSLVSEPVEVMTNTLPWEGDLVEGTWMVRRPDGYYMFYSANAFYDERYAVGVARSASPFGPFQKLGDPILKSDQTWSGPGHGSLVTDASGRDWFIYHAWRKGHEGGENPRMLLVDEVKWGPSGWPTIHDGTPSD